MLKLLENMKQLYVCCGYVDMRKGIEGLAAVVQIKYGKQIEEGSLFVSVLREKSRSLQRSVLGFKRIRNAVQALIQWTVSMAEKQRRISADHTAAVSLAHGRAFNISRKNDKKHETRQPVLSIIVCN